MQKNGKNAVGNGFPALDYFAALSYNGPNDRKQRTARPGGRDRGETI